MLRTFGLIVGGMFVGVAAVEIIRKKYPDALDKLYTRIGAIAVGVKEGFKEGFGNAVKSEAPTKA